MKRPFLAVAVFLSAPIDGDFSPRAFASPALEAAAAPYHAFMESVASGPPRTPDSGALAVGWTAAAAQWALEAPGFEASARSTALLGVDEAAESILGSPLAAPTAGLVQATALEDVAALRLAAERWRDALIEEGAPSLDNPPPVAAPDAPDIESIPLAPVRGAWLMRLLGDAWVGQAQAQGLSPGLRRALSLAAGAVAGADAGWITARAGDASLARCLRRADLNRRQCDAASASDAEKRYCAALYAADAVADCLLTQIDQAL